MNIRLNDIASFLVASENRTLSEAAEQLGITLPSLSESIRRLERDLNQKLFYRTRTGISHTPAGKSQLIKAKQLSSLISEMAIGSLKRSVVIGCHPTVGSYFLPKLFSKLESAFEQFEFSIRHGLSRDVLMMVRDGAVDVAFVINPAQSPDLVMRKIGTDQIAVWGTAGANQNRLFASLALNQTQFILRKWKHAPPSRIDSDNLELIAQLALSGQGIAILPERAVQLNAKSLKRIPNTPHYDDSIYIVHRPEFGKSKSEADLLRLAFDSVRAQA